MPKTFIDAPQDRSLSGSDITPKAERACTLAEAKTARSVGNVGGSYGHAPIQTLNGLFKAEVIRHRRLFFPCCVRNAFYQRVHQIGIKRAMARCYIDLGWHARDHSCITQQRNLLGWHVNAQGIV